MPETDAELCPDCHRPTAGPPGFGCRLWGGHAQAAEETKAWPPRIETK